MSVHGVLHDERGRPVGGKALFGRDVTLRLTSAQVEALRPDSND